MMMAQQQSNGGSSYTSCSTSTCSVATAVAAENNENSTTTTAMMTMTMTNLVTTTDHLNALLQQENWLYPLCRDYLMNDVATTTPSSSTSSSPPGEEESTTTTDSSSSNDIVSEAWRRKLCEWAYEVVDHFNFDREVVSYALNYLDRTVAIKTESTQVPLPKREFQLVAVTSLYLAIKIHGETDDQHGPRRKLRVDAFVELSRGFFTVDVIIAMERTMLHLLQWRVNPPSHLRFISSFLRLCPKWTPQEQQQGVPHSTLLRNIYDVARYLTELSLCVSCFTFEFKTSATAYAAILCAIRALSSPLPDHVRVSFLKNIAEHCGLEPSSSDVRQAYLKLKELCPSMFGHCQEDDDNEESFPPEFLLVPSDVAGSVSAASQQLLQQQQNNNDLLLSEGNTSPVSVVDTLAVVHHHQHHQQQQAAIMKGGGGGGSPSSTRKRSHGDAAARPPQQHHHHQILSHHHPHAAATTFSRTS